MSWFVTLNGKGRFLIPREVRDNLGLEMGDSLWLDIRGSEIVLRKIAPGKEEDSEKDDLAEFLADIQ